MKLFQQMLVAGASLSLIAPLGASATDLVNIEEMNSYSRSNTKKSSRLDSKTFTNEISEDIVNLKGRVDEENVQQNAFEAGMFSDTTTMDGKAIFTLGALDYDNVDASEAAMAFYSYTLNLNSSFTGDDNLYVRIKTGNADDWADTKTYGTYLSSAKGNSDALKVDKIWYQFPIGENNTVWVGPKIENYYMHGATPSIYKPVTKQFTLGGNGNAYGASTDTGFGWAYQADNGFSISSNIGTKSHSSVEDANENYIATGLLTDQTKTSWATQVGYTDPQYSISAIVNVKSNGWSDSYYKAGDINGDAEANSQYTAVGLRGWWRPENTGTNIPSISLGLDYTEYDASSGQSGADAWFVGLNWQDIFNPDDRIGAAFGQPTRNESSDVTPFAYELYYSFKANDSVTMTPTIFGGSDRNGVAGEDVMGAVFETTFKF
tara:strand:+ start:314 stop:1612 length:1299 start_codon:yes stop_codon:yes gene_type:complete